MEIAIFFTYMYILFFGALPSEEIQQEYYTVLKGLKIANPYQSISLYYDSMAICSSFCLGQSTCVSANYNKKTKTCELNNKSPSNETSTIIENSDWKLLYVPDGQ